MAFVNFFNRCLHEMLVIFQKLFYLHFVTYSLGNNTLRSHKYNTNLRHFRRNKHIFCQITFEESFYKVRFPFSVCYQVLSFLLLSTLLH